MGGAEIGDEPIAWKHPDHPVSKVYFPLAVTAVNETKCSRLRASFIRVPAPTGPACTVFEAISDSAFFASA